MSGLGHQEPGTLKLYTFFIFALQTPQFGKGTHHTWHRSGNNNHGIWDYPSR